MRKALARRLGRCRLKGVRADETKRRSILTREIQSLKNTYIKQNAARFFARLKRKLDTTMTNKNTVSGINWSKVACTNAQGGVDLDETMSFLREELVAFVETNEIPAATIAAAVDEVFSKINQTDLNGLANRVALMLNAPVESQTKVAKRVLDFIRAESATFKASNGESGGYVILPGAGGGTRKSSAATKELFAKMSAKKAAKAPVSV